MTISIQKDELSVKIMNYADIYYHLIGSVGMVIIFVVRVIIVLSVLDGEN